MRAPRNCIVDLGAAHVLAAVFARGSGRRLVLERCEFEPIGGDPVSDASWVEQAATALTRIAGRLRWSGPTRLVVPGHLALVKWVRTPAIDRSRRAGVVRFEAAQNFPYPLDEVVWDHSILGENEREMELLLAAAKRVPMEVMCAAPLLRDAELELAVPSCVALVRALRFAHPEAAPGTLLLSIGARSTHVLLLTGKGFAGRTISLGGTSLTRVVAERLRIDFEHAETLKKSVLGGGSALSDDSAARAVVNGSADTFARKLCVEVSRSLAGWSCRGEIPPISTVFLDGGGSTIPALPALLHEKLGVPLQRLDPLRSVILDLSSGDAARDAVPLTAESVGLAADLVAPGAPCLNLLPRAAREGAVAKRRRPVLLAVAALLLVALAAPAWRYYRSGVLARAESEVAEHELSTLRLRAGQTDALWIRLESARSETEKLRTLDETRRVWLRFLGDLERRFAEVGEVWLDELRLEPTITPSEVADEAEKSPPRLRIQVSGRMLDPGSESAGHPSAHERLRRMLASLAESPSISAVEGERFDRTAPGVLQFHLTLVTNERARL